VKKSPLLVTLPDQIRVIAVGGTALRQGQELIVGCEFCHPDDAEIPFDWILDKVTGRRGSTTDYILTELALCPNCKCELIEKTLVVA
jgi:hypothetical protein